MSDPAISHLNVLVVGMGEVAQSILDALITPHYKHRVHAFILVPRILQLDDAAQRRIDAYGAQMVHTLEGEITAAAVEFLSNLFQQHKIDTVVSCLTAQQAELQHALIDAARHGGVGHFLPSLGLGVDYEHMAEDDPLSDASGRAQCRVHRAVKESGMDWTLMACGALAEQLLTSDDYGVDLTHRTVRVPQPLDLRITYTALKDVGQLTAMAVCDSSTRNKQLLVGRTTTTQQVIDALRRHAKGDKEWAVEELSAEQLQALAQSEPKRLFPRMALSTARGTRVTAWEEAQTWENGKYKYEELEAVAARVFAVKEESTEK